MLPLDSIKKILSVKDSYVIQLFPDLEIPGLSRRIWALLLGIFFALTCRTTMSYVPPASENSIDSEMLHEVFEKLVSASRG